MDVDRPARDPDVLSAGPSQHRPGWRRWQRSVGVAICVVVVAALAGRAGDQALRHREYSALLRTTVDAQATAEHADARVLSTRQYTMPLLTSAPAGVRKGLAQLIADSAGEGVTELRATRAAVASTSVLPWHSAIRKAKAAELDYLDEWTAYLASVAIGGDIGATPTPVVASRQT